MIPLKLLAAARRKVAENPGGGSDGAEVSSLFAAGEKGAWYDVQDLTTIFQDPAGTIPATEGSRVGKLLDKSGNGNHLVQDYPADWGPILKRYPNGGVWYLDFNQSIGMITMRTPAPINANGASDLTLIFALRRTDFYNGQTEFAFDYRSDNGAAPGFYYQPINGSGYQSDLAITGEQNYGTLIRRAMQIGDVTGPGGREINAAKMLLSGDTAQAEYPSWRRNAVDQYEFHYSTPTISAGPFANHHLALGGWYRIYMQAWYLCDMHFYGLVMRFADTDTAKIIAVENEMNAVIGAF